LKRLYHILGGLFLSLFLHAGDGVISINLYLTPITSQGIFVDSTKLVLTGNDRYIVDQVVITGDTVDHRFDSLDAGDYSLAVEIYQQDYIIAENFSRGYLGVDETREIKGRIILACAYPILYLNWNPDLIVTGDDFYDYAIDPDSNYLRRYPLPHLDSLAAAFRDSGMHYYQEYVIHWGLLDTNLIPIVEYPWGFHRNPVTTSHTAFAFYDAYVRDRDSLSYVGFMNNVNWLLENMDSNFYLHYDFDFRHQNVVLDSGWVTGMAQGLVLVAISLAYYETGEEKYMDAAVGLFGTLYRNTGGYYSVGVDEQDYYWLEEYPSSDFCHVFNGYVAALWGLWCYYTISGDDFAGVLLEAGIKTIVDNYPKWNIINQDLSYYCLHKRIDPKYHEKHKVQLRTYGDYFPVPEMHNGANCFENTYFAAYPRAINVAPDSSMSKIKLVSSLTWDVETDEDWLTLTRKGDVLEVTCSENIDTASRSAWINFTAPDTNDLQTILVSQAGADYPPKPRIDSFYVSADSGQLRFNINYDTGWVVTTNTSWIETKKESDTVFSFQYEDNISLEKRTGIVEVYLNDSVLLHQIMLFQDSLHHFIFLKPDSVWVTSDSGGIDIYIETNAPWEITDSVPWMDARKVNDTLLHAKYLENTDYLQPRTAKLILYQLDSMVLTELKIVQGTRPLYLELDPISLYVNADSGFNRIDVHAPVSWTAEPSESWLITATSNDSTLYVLHLMNTLRYERTGTILVSLNDTLKKDVRIIQMANTVGINDSQVETELEIYPNPATSDIHIRITAHEAGMLAVEIYNLAGVKVMDRKIPCDGDQAVLNVSTLGNGIYFVKVTTSARSFISKLFIE